MTQRLSWSFLAVAAVVLCVRYGTYDGDSSLVRALQESDASSCGVELQERFKCEAPGCPEMKTLVNYINFYYCGSFPRVLTFILYLLLIFYVLRILGNTADEYFCSCLESVVVLYHISANIAGVTFLSFGNGAADVFSLIVSFMNGNPELGLSGVMGSCLFTCTVVVALILRISPVKVEPFQFMRNLIFFAASLLYVFAVFLVGWINIIESITLVMLYVVFVVSVIFCNPRKKDQLVPVEANLLEFDYTEAERLEESLNRRLGRKREASSDVADRGLKRVKFEDRPKWRHIFTVEGQRRLRAGTEESADSEDESYTILHAKEVLKSTVTDIKESRWFKMPLKVVEWPLVVLRKLTIPIYDEEDYSYQMSLIAFLLLPLWVGINLIPFVWWQLFLYLGVGLFLSFLCSRFTQDDGPPKSRAISTIFILGSALSCIMWIYNLANELVNLLQSMGKIVGLSERVMGLSILAFGNSIDDFIADVSLARQGFATMALTGAVCSPMFQLLFGLGCGLTIQTSKGVALMRDAEMGTRGMVTLILVFSSILVGLFTTMVMLVLKSYTLPSKYSYVLLSMYALTMAFVLLIEFKAIKI